MTRFGFSQLNKHLVDFKDEHPLLVLFRLNPKYMECFDQLLSEVDGLPNLGTKIKELKDPGNWQSVVSELRFAGMIKSLNPEFIPRQRFPYPDAKLSFVGEDIFFEVKLLAENDPSQTVYKEIWTVESDPIIEIAHGILNRDLANKLIDFVKEKLEKQEIGEFDLDYAYVKISKKEPSTIGRTWVIMRTRETMVIPFEPLRRKIFMDFYDKIHQFSSERIVFWAIDLRRWKYDEDDIRTVVYGDTVTDLTVGRHHYRGFQEIYEAHDRNSELFNNTGIVPTFTYPKKKGLFFLKDAECLNGVIVMTSDTLYLFVNPFADPQLDLMKFRKFREHFSR